MEVIVKLRNIFSRENVTREESLYRVVGELTQLCYNINTEWVSSEADAILDRNGYYYEGKR